MTETEKKPAEHRVTRRTVVKGVAWSVPAIALASAAPAMAQSCSQSGEHRAPRPTLTGKQDTGAMTTTWPVPAGVHELYFEVVGAPGGAVSGFFNSRAMKVTGRLTVTPGEVLTLVVGQGGYFVDTQTSPSSGWYSGSAGGRGFGDGGSNLYTPVAGLSAWNAGGSGGGGSAIVASDGSPLVVAGGGGGIGKQQAMVPSTAGNWWNAPIDNPEGGGWQAYQEGTDRKQSVAHGKWGTTSAVGAGGDGNWGTAWGTTTHELRWDSGLSGLAGPRGNGADARNRVHWTQDSSYANVGVQLAAGAGGGGYNGGGSGALHAADYDYRLSNWTVAAIGGEGGHGGCFADAARAANVDLTLRSPAEEVAQNRRAPGFILLRWTC